ncbi:hypothetical protein ACXYMX_00520 [Sporosarcina sp. CAU 1771]
MNEIKIDMKGRKRIKFTVEEMSSDEIISIAEYDDGTILKMIQRNDGQVSVECNKTFEVQPDGVTVKII